MFDRDTATVIMQAVGEANRRLGIDEEAEDAESVSYDPDQDAFPSATRTVPSPSTATTSTWMASASAFTRLAPATGRR
jgi:hypothetical protein